MKNLRTMGEPLTFVLNCQLASHGEIKYFWPIPKLSPWATGMFDIFCILYLAFFRGYKFLWKEHSRKAKISSGIAYCLFFISMCDIIYSMINENYAYLSNFLRPIICLSYLGPIRSNMKAVAYDLRESITILTMIFAMIFYFSMVGLFIFQGNFGGIVTFPSLGEGYYNMLILLTTANFPDVMLPNYQSNPLSCLFFIGFLVLGLYFLLNVMLAVVFENYKNRIKQVTENKTEKRLEYIKKQYAHYDEDEKGFLTITQAKKFFAYVIPLNFKLEQDRQSFKNIMTMVDPDGEMKAHYVDIEEFFQLPNFLEIIAKKSDKGKEQTF